MNYRLNDWGSGFTTDLTITNLSAKPIDGWTLEWTFAGNQKITNAWNAEVVQSGQRVTAKNLSWNRTIGANGGTVMFGFQAAYSGSNGISAFTLNGTTCSTG